MQWSDLSENSNYNVPVFILYDKRNHLIVHKSLFLEWSC